VRSTEHSKLARSECEIRFIRVISSPCLKASF